MNRYVNQEAEIPNDCCCRWKIHLFSFFPFFPLPLYLWTNTHKRVERQTTKEGILKSWFLLLRLLLLLSPDETIIQLLLFFLFLLAFGLRLFSCLLVCPSGGSFKESEETHEGRYLSSCCCCFFLLLLILPSPFQHGSSGDDVDGDRQVLALFSFWKSECASNLSSWRNHTLAAHTPGVVVWRLYVSVYNIKKKAAMQQQQDRQYNNRRQKSRQERDSFPTV